MSETTAKPKLSQKSMAAIIFGWFIVALGIIGVTFLLISGEWLSPFLMAFYPLLALFTVFIFTGYSKRVIEGKELPRPVSALLAIFMIGVLVGSTYLVVFYSPMIAAKNFKSKPYLNWFAGQNASTDMCVSWVSSERTVGSVKYGTSPSELNDEMHGDIEATKYHHILLTGLSPNTTYYYQTSDSPDIYYFRTAPVGEFNFSFSAWADHRTNTKTQKSVWELNQPNVVEHIDRVFRETGRRNEFSVFAGDLVDVPGAYLDWKTWFEDISYNNFSCNAPVQVIFGNHERYKGEPNFTICQDFYPLPMGPDNRFAHSFDYGPIHFIMLDPYDTGHSWSENFSDYQLNWLKGDLEANKDSPYKLIYMHPWPTKLSGVKADLEILCGKYNITMIFCGHYHEFAHETLNGTDVVVLGLGGNPNNVYQEAGLECGTAFGIYDVTTNNLKFTAQMINGTTLLELNYPR